MGRAQGRPPREGGRPLPSEYVEYPLGVRLEREMVELVDRVVAYLQERNPGVNFSRSDALRFMIRTFELPTGKH